MTLRINPWFLGLFITCIVMLAVQVLVLFPVGHYLGSVYAGYIPPPM